MYVCGICNASTSSLFTSKILEEIRRRALVWKRFNFILNINLNPHKATARHFRENCFSCLVRLLYFLRRCSFKSQNVNLSDLKTLTFRQCFGRFMQKIMKKNPTYNPHEFRTSCFRNSYNIRKRIFARARSALFSFGVWENVKNCRRN